MRTSISRAIRVLATAAVLGHLGLTVAYNLPDNPLREQLVPVLDGYVGRFFSQNWRLFAPNPASSNIAVLVACVDDHQLTAIQSQLGTDGELQGEYDWADISDPLVRGHQRSRFSAYDRLLRAQLNAARSVISLPLYLVLATRSCRKGDETACEAIDEHFEYWRASAAAYLERLASSYCLATAPDASGVAIAIRERQAIPWSKRHDPNATAESRELLVAATEIYADVMPAPIYLAPTTEAP